MARLVPFLPAHFCDIYPIPAAESSEDDHNWPEPDRVGRQELEVKLGKEHISFTVRIGALPCDAVALTTKGGGLYGVLRAEWVPPPSRFSHRCIDEG